jgi:hypothetical protein
MMPEYLQEETVEEVETFDASLFSKKIRVGRRTYYIDVRKTRSEDLFLSITEMRRVVTPSGDVVNERRKIHVYEEDIEKFVGGINEALEYIKETIDKAPSDE